MGTKFFNNREGNTLLREFARVFKELDVKDLDILVAYFRASGYKDLQPHLSGIENIRTIVGMGLDEKIKKHHKTVLSSPNSDDEMRSQVLDSIRRDIEEAAYDSKVEKGIKRFFDDVASEKLRLRIHPQRNLHAKFYIYRPAKFDKNNRGEVIMGSSNLTSTGLGSGHEGGNYELNVRLKEYSDVKFATEEFKRLWEESKELSASDIREVQRNSCIEHISPYHLYMKFLMEYFGPDFDVDKSGNWPTQFHKLAYQVDAVNEAIRKLEKHDGLFLADVVGLGKTVMASAIAQSFWNRQAGKSGILVISPPALKNHWKEALEAFLPYAYIKYETPGRLQHVSDDSHRYGLVIIDESHRFRNKGTSQYERLQEICKTRTIKDKAKKILLISATPLNNRPDDIYNQISLFMDGEDNSLNEKPLAQYFRELRAADREIKRLNNREEARRQAKALYSRMRSQIIEKITIRRTRTDLKENKRYAADLDFQNIEFPSARLERVYYKLPGKLNNLYDETIATISGNEQGLSYMRYQILDYVERQAVMRDEASAGAVQLAQIMKSLLLKRMDSSFVAFKKTLEKFIESSKVMLKMIDEDKIFIVKDMQINEFILEDRQDELSELLDTRTRKGQIVTREDLKPGFIQGVESDHKILLDLRKKWNQVLKDEDPKFDQFARELRGWLEHRSNRERKLVVFTESADTMKHLSQRLKTLPYKFLAVDSSNARSEQASIKNDFDASLPEGEQKDHCQILITTDVLAEGVNLHRANLIVNYDTPWNVVKLMQRIGRVNRIGTKAKEIIAYNFLPTEKINDDLRLEEKALIKAQAFHSALGADSQIYSDEEETITFRIFKENLAEERNKELPFREELRAFKRSNEEEYNLIKAKSLKQRNAVPDNRRKKRTLVFVRTANRRTSSFYLVGPNAGDLKPLDFIQCAGLLRSGKDKEAVLLPGQHHQQVRAAINNFLKEQQEIREDVHSEASWSRQNARVASILKSLSDFKGISSEHAVLLRKAIETIKSGNRQKFNRELRERANEFIGKNPSSAYVAELAEFIKCSMPDGTLQQSVGKLDLPPTVVIAQSYTE